MDSRSWRWRRRSSEKVTSLVGSSDSSPAHSATCSDDQDATKTASGHLQMPEEATILMQQSEEKLKSLNEKLSQALLDNIEKDSLVEKHTKVAEEAVSGWEDAKRETMTLKEQFDTVIQQKLALEDRASHLDDALKECMRELRHVREEQEQKIHESVVKKTREWDKTKFELETRIVELEQLLNEAKAKNNKAPASLQESSKALSDLHEAKNQAETEAKVLRSKLEALEIENSALKNKLHALSKDVNVIIEERDMTKKSAQAANKQHLETVKKVTKLEAECQKLRCLVRKRLPGPAALAQMKVEVETVGKESGEVKLRRSLSKGVGSPHSSVESSHDRYQGHAQKEVEYLTEQLMAMEEETKILKDTLSKRNSELKDSRVMCAKTAAKLASVEQQLESFRRKQEKPPLELHLEASRSGSTNPPSLASISEDGNDGDPCAESWASALIAELDHFKKDKVSGKIEKLSDLPKVDLMDDFLEMERLASMPSTRLDQTRIGKLDDFTEKNVEGSFGLSVQEDRASLEALAQQELKLQEVNQECSELRKKLSSLQENLIALQARNAWSESALVNIQEKFDIILEAESEGADVHKVLDDIKCAMTVAAESAGDSRVCNSPCLKPESISLGDTGSKISTINVEFATAAASVVNFLRCIAQETGEMQNFKALDSKKLDEGIQEFAQSMDQFLHCKANVIELLSELICFLSQFRKMFAHDSDENTRYGGTDVKNRTCDLIQSSLLNKCIFTGNLSRQASAQSLSGRENIHRLRFPLAGGNFHIIRKLNCIQVEKASLESVLKAQVSRCGDLEEELMRHTSEKVDLETMLAATKEKLEQTQCQVTNLEEEIMHLKSENKNLDKILATTKVKLEHTQYQGSEIQVELTRLKSGNCNLETNLAAAKKNFELTEYQLTKAEEELKHFKTENANLEAVLAATKEKLEHTHYQLTELEEKVANLEVQLESAEESKRLSENKLAALSLRKSSLESQLNATEIEMQSLSEKVYSLELELQEERIQCKDAMNRCKVLQEQLERKQRGSEFSKYSVVEEEIRKRQEREIAAAAGKLAEFQETVQFLRTKLQELTTPVDTLEFPYDTEKRTERDQRFELDAPWSPRSQTASSSSEVENSSTLTGREITGQWISEPIRVASDLCEGNAHDTLNPADYMDGQFSLSDTEESSPARSPDKSSNHKNMTRFLEGTGFSKPVKLNEGESPTSSSSISSLTSTFFPKTHE